MNLRVIEGGRHTFWEVPSIDISDIEPPGPQRADVRLEADRRLRRLGYDRWRNRQLATGLPMPRDVRYGAMQIEFVAEKLASLTEIPADFRADVYWPA
ncbi:MAG: hypothetical protein ACK4QP_07600 [Pseudorhizobium sp.]